MKSANYENLCELSGFDGSDHEHFSLLCYCAAQSRWSRLTFQRCVLPPSSGRWRSEISVYFNEITWRNIPQGWNLYENLLMRFLTILLFLSLTECSKWAGICRYTIPKLLFVSEFHTVTYHIYYIQGYFCDRVFRNAVPDLLFLGSVKLTPSPTEFWVTLCVSQWLYPVVFFHFSDGISLFRF
jgi:hypothetical protein